MWQIAWNQFRLQVRSKSNLISMFLMPLAFALIFGGMGGGGSGGPAVYPVAVIDLDGSFASAELVAALGRDSLLRTRTAAEAEVERLFADRAIGAAIRIPPGFGAGAAAGEAPAVELVTPPTGNPQMAVSPAVRRVAGIVATDYRMARLAAGSEDRQAVEAAYARIRAERSARGETVSHAQTERRQPERRMRAAEASSVGFTVMFVMAHLFGMGGVVLQERHYHTWDRLLTAPLGRGALIGGFGLSYFVTGFFQFGGLVLLTRLLFRVDWGPLLPLAAVAAAFILCSAGLGMLFASLVRTLEQHRAVGTLLVVATSMLGGVYWPLEIVGETMRRIGYLTPQAWAMDGLRAVMLRGGAWESLLLPIAVLVAMGLVFMAGGAARIRYS